MMHGGGASMAFFPIGKPKIRNLSIETKKMGLLKKVEELSTLCGVKTCAIIYTSDIDFIPQTWPVDHLQVQMFLANVKSLPEYERTKFSNTADTLVEQRIKKAKLKVARLMRESKIKQMREHMSHLFDGRKLSISLDGYRDLSLVIDRALKDVKRRMEELMMTKAEEVNVLKEQQNTPNQDLMKLVENEMGSSSQGLGVDYDLIYPGGTTSECDLITNFDFNFEFEEDQWF